MSEERWPYYQTCSHVSLIQGGCQVLLWITTPYNLKQLGLRNWMTFEVAHGMYDELQRCVDDWNTNPSHRLIADSYISLFACDNCFPSNGSVEITRPIPESIGGLRAQVELGWWAPEEDSFINPEFNEYFPLWWDWIDTSSIDTAEEALARISTWVDVLAQCYGQRYGYGVQNRSRSDALSEHVFTWTGRTRNCTLYKKIV